MRIESRVPVRVDLAGGTIDLWPIYLIVQSARTVNLGVNLTAETHIELSQQPSRPGVRLLSADQHSAVELTWSDLQSFSAPPYLDLHVRLLKNRLQTSAVLSKWYGSSVTLRTLARSPAGAGLGGSSALCISILGALEAVESVLAQRSLQLDEPTRIHLIKTARDTESQVLRGPAGLQDYYGAAFGGLQSIRWGTATHDRRSLSLHSMNDVASRLVLFYSGLSRNSGINNWQVYKDFIDRQGDIPERLQSIANATVAFETALEQGNWAQATQSIREEWTARKGLASGISTSDMDLAFSLIPAITSDFAVKICGAGGGGCFFVWLPSADPVLKQKVIQTLTQHDRLKDTLKHLPFEAVPHGLSVTTEAG